MRLQQLTQLRLVGVSLVILTLLLWADVGMAQEAVTVYLEPVGGSGVSGTAILTAAGEGTSVELDVQGLPPGTTARATMQANTCIMPSASFATLPDLTADAAGRATATGAVLFRGTDEVALATMADGAHIIAIQTDRMVACGVIPALTATVTLPATGGAAIWLMPILLSLLGLGRISAPVRSRVDLSYRSAPWISERNFRGTVEPSHERV